MTEFELALHRASNPEMAAELDSLLAFFAAFIRGQKLNKRETMYDPVLNAFIKKWSGEFPTIRDIIQEQWIATRDTL